MMIAMTTEGKDQGLCSAALRELWRIAKDQIEERDVVVIVMSRNLAAWRKASMKSVKREDQLKCINAEEMRTITNDECVAGKIKFDESENAVMDESRIGKFEQGDRKHKLKNDAMDGVEDGRSVDCRGDEKETVKSVVSFQWMQNGLTQAKRSRGSLCTRMCVREIRSDDRTKRHAETSSLEALERS